MDIHPLIMQLIVGYTCVGVFIATSIAVVMNLFGVLKIEASLRKKLHVTLLGEVVAIAVATFGGLISVAPKQTSDILNASAGLAADSLEGPLAILRRKGLESEEASVLVATKMAVFSRISIFKDDTKLLAATLAVLERRGLTTKKVNKEVLSSYPDLLKEKLRWLRDKALPELIKDEAYLEDHMQEQREPYANVEVPPSLRLSAEASSTITVEDRPALQEEVRMLQSVLSND